MLSLSQTAHDSKTPTAHLLKDVLILDIDNITDAYQTYSIDFTPEAIEEMKLIIRIKKKSSYPMVSSATVLKVEQELQVDTETQVTGVQACASPCIVLHCILPPPGVVPEPRVDGFHLTYSYKVVKRSLYDAFKETKENNPTKIPRV
ncbi:hypothetical protein PAXRUDRAFT_36362 [Paxillus rubicundulus Ve08.2h10]|uniref:Uncharacterized protein n=1 Tax=Paxillus rubicundulus Ve08.2h10 TaxID=930991 RepID=A0A0D0DMN7_9AGAM|nr:hypothetical protein PAXRUDRAFT_36362 [Paxillus rubicundulus Ve08.2h10]